MTSLDSSKFLTVVFRKLGFKMGQLDTSAGDEEEETSGKSVPQQDFPETTRNGQPGGTSVSVGDSQSQSRSMHHHISSGRHSPHIPVNISATIYVFSALLPALGVSVLAFFLRLFS